MSVNCVIALPDNVRVSTVATVLGSLLGQPRIMQPLGGDCKYDYITMPTVEIKTTGTPDMCLIVTKTLFGDPCTAYYFFESDRGGRLLMFNSTPLRCAVGRRLVEFFGGRVMYDDCKGRWNFSRPARPDKENRPSDGKPWQQLQERIYALHAVSGKEIAKFKKVAAYPD